MSNLKKNYMYQIFYQMLVLSLPLITAPYISRTLGAEGIGIYSYTSSIAGLFIIFAMLGINNQGIREISIVREEKKLLSEKFSNLFAVQILTSTFAVLCYVIYIQFFVEQYRVIYIIQIIYVLSAITDINWFFYGLEKFKLTVIRNAIVKVASVCSIFLFVNSLEDIYIYTVIMVLSMSVNNLLLWPYVKKYIYFVKPNITMMKKQLKPLLLLFIPILAISFYKLLDKVMIGILSSAEEVGFYANSEKIIDLPMGIITALGIVMLPKISNLVNDKKKAGNDNYIENSLVFVTFLAVALMFGIAGIAPEFGPVFFGEEFQVTGILISVFSPTILFLSWANVIRTQYLLPYKKDNSYIISVIAGAVVNVTFNLILIPYYGALGAVIGTVMAEATVCLIQINAVKKRIPVLKYLKSTIIFFFSGFVMYVIVRIIGENLGQKISTLIYQIGSGIVIYLIISLFLIYFSNNQPAKNLISKVKIN